MVLAKFGIKSNVDVFVGRRRVVKDTTEIQRHVGALVTKIGAPECMTFLR
jgi:hypothetical protein